MSIFDEIKMNDVELATPQIVDEMTVVPIVGRNRDDIAPPESLKFTGTATYGIMTFENTDSRPAIVPAHMTARAKNSGQDHAMAGAEVAKAGKNKYSNCCCIEASRGGRLEGEMDSYDILPLSLRKAFNKQLREQKEFGKLWESIRSWMRGLTPDARAHLVDFYDSEKFKDRLEQFAAEFEPVPNQIGALILFNGVPVGIEIMPSEKHWEAYWKYVIRGCYGAELIRLKELNKIKPSALLMPEIPEGATPEEAASVLDSFMQHIKEQIKPLFDQVKVTQRTTLSKGGDVTKELIETGSKGVGDVVYKNNEPVYVSIVL